LGFTTLHDFSTTCDATEFRDAWAPHTLTQTQMRGVSLSLSLSLSYLSYGDDDSPL
jgi:hypothetical protein